MSTSSTHITTHRCVRSYELWVWVIHSIRMIQISFNLLPSVSTSPSPPSNLLLFQIMKSPHIRNIYLAFYWLAMVSIVENISWDSCKYNRFWSSLKHMSDVQFSSVETISFIIYIHNSVYIWRLVEGNSLLAIMSYVPRPILLPVYQGEIGISWWHSNILHLIDMVVSIKKEHKNRTSIIIDPGSRN